MSSTTLNSPLKGIERLTDELKNERQKATNALQEKARSRIEIKSLEQVIGQQNQTIEALQSSCDQYNYQIVELNNVIEDLKKNEEILNKDLEFNIVEINKLNDELKSTQIELQQSQDNTSEKDSIIKSLSIKVDSLDSRLINKEDISSELRNEIQTLRQNYLQMEQKFLDSNEEVNDLVNANERLKSQLELTDIIESNYNEAKISNDKLREEIETNSKLYSQLNNKFKELNNLYDNKIKDEIALQQQYDELIIEKDQFLKHYNETIIIKEELSNKASAEMENALAAKVRSDVALKSRDLLDDQLKELFEAYNKSVEDNNSLEIKLRSSNDVIVSLQDKINDMNEKLFEAESLMGELDTMRNMALEIETLRIQLTEVRKQLIKRDIDDEVSILNPKSLIDRENSGRQVYEKIISDLRNDLDKTNSKYFECSRKLEDAIRRVSKMEQLEDEIKIYKEMTKSISIDNQTVVISASEAVEKSIKASHEKSNILYDIHRLENEISSSNKEIVVQKNEIFSLREHIKLLQSEKLSAERKVTEISTINSRLETNIEEHRIKSEFIGFELDKSKKQIAEQLIKMSELNNKNKELEKLKNDLSISHNNFTLSKTTANKREHELSVEVTKLLNNKQIIENENNSMKNKINSLRDDVHNLQNEISKLKADNEIISGQRDNYKKELLAKESSRAEKQLVDLKKDLEITITEWKELENEKSLKDRLINQLQTDLMKEKEKYTILKMHHNSLEDNVKILNQELSVFKSIDIYQSSMHSELQSLRNDKLAKSQSLSNNNNNANNSYLNNTIKSSDKYHQSLSESTNITEGSKLSLDDMKINNNNNSHNNYYKKSLNTNNNFEEQKGIDYIEKNNKIFHNYDKHVSKISNETPMSYKDSNKDSYNNNNNNNNNNEVTKKSSSIFRPAKTDFERARRLLSK